MLEPTAAAATLAPSRDLCPSPCPSPLPSPPPCATLPLTPPAVRLALEDGGGGGLAEEEGDGGGAEAGQAGAESVCRVMGLLGMGHRLFVPKLLAVSGSLAPPPCL